MRPELEEVSMLEKEATGEARKLEKEEKMGGEITICPPRPEEKRGGRSPPPRKLMR